jgi:hypothetical protein
LEAGGPDRGAHGPGSFDGADSEGVRRAQQGRAAGTEQSDGSDLGEIRTRCRETRKVDKVGRGAMGEVEDE